VLINQLAFVLVERFHDKQVDCHATVSGVAGQFAQDHLLKVLALAEVIVDLPNDFPRGAAGGNSCVRACCGRTGVCGPTCSRRCRRRTEGAAGAGPRGCHR
jgi:hypothetical protein